MSPPKCSGLGCRVRTLGHPGHVHIWAAAPPHAWELSGVQISPPSPPSHPQPGSHTPISFPSAGEGSLPRDFLAGFCCMHSFIQRLLFEHLHWARQWGRWQLNTYVYPGSCHLSRACPTTRTHVPSAPRSHTPLGGRCCFCFSRSTREENTEPVSWGSFVSLLPFSNSSGHQTGEPCSYSPVSPQTFLCTYGSHKELSL